MATTARAQQESVTLPGTRLTVEEVMKTIQQQTGCVFAFNSRMFDVTRTVQTPSTAASVGELLELITVGTDFSWLQRPPYIVIHYAPRPDPPLTPKPRTGDKYAPSDPSADAFSARPPLPQPSSGSDLGTVSPTSPVEFPTPFSDWYDPDNYSPIRRALPGGALKTDLLYGAATLTPNIGLEVGLGARSTLELTWGWNQRNHEGSRRNNRKLNHGLARLEYRRWFCERFDGHYIGGHVFGTKYNVGGYDIPTLFERELRYEGWAFGAGLTYGYHLALARRWGLDFHVGVGVAHYRHTRFECVRCGTERDRPSGVWFGPTRAGVDLVFLLWK